MRGGAGDGDRTRDNLLGRKKVTPQNRPNCQPLRFENRGEIEPGPPPLADPPARRRPRRAVARALLPSELASGRVPRQPSFTDRLPGLLRRAGGLTFVLQPHRGNLASTVRAAPACKVSAAADHQGGDQVGFLVHPQSNLSSGRQHALSLRQRIFSSGQQQHVLVAALQCLLASGSGTAARLAPRVAGHRAAAGLGHRPQ
jgi:hypothetical protein